jgi:PAS domain S-box-containing protein
VADLLARKVAELPPPTREALEIAACAGDQVDLDLLSAALGSGAGETRARVAPAIRERLLVPRESDYPIGLVDVSAGSAPERVNYHYRFLHDRVRHAAYDAIPEASRPQLHLRIGRMLLECAGPDPRGQRIFDIVDQLNRAIAFVTDGAERLRLCRLNLEAGERAQKTTAYKEALEYLRHGRELLPADARRDHYRLWLGLNLRFAECAYLAGRFDEASAFSDALLPQIRTAVEKAELASIRMALEASRGRNERALELGAEALAALDHPVPPMTTELPIVLARARVAVVMAGRRVEDLDRLPELTDPRLLAVVKILDKMLAPAFQVNQRLFAWICHETVVLTVRYGICAAAATGFIDYSNYIIQHQRDYARALAFGRLALAIVEREDAVALRCHVHFVLGACSQGYAENHLRTCIPLLKRAMELGLESGDLLFSTFAAGAIPEIMFMVGEPVDAILREVELRERSLRGSRLEYRLLELRIVRQCMRCMRGETRGRASLTTDDLQEAALVAQVQALPGFVVGGVYYMMKMILHVLYGETGEAIRIVLTFDRDIQRSQSAAIRVTGYAFFACLALARGLRDPQLDQRALHKVLDKWRRLLEDWAENAPVNFRHKHLLVSAELAEARGRTGEATRCYEAAIAEATANGFPHHAALASELAGRAFAERGQPYVARTYLEAARAGYARWGAYGKVRAMDEDHPGLASAEVAAERLPDSLDALGVVRASQALSSEIALPALLERLMRVVVQAAGARRGTLLVESDERLRVDAHFDAMRNVLETPPDGGRAPELVSEAIVRSTLRTGKDVLLAHAAEEGAFTHDPYIASHASKSVLCLAVRHRDRVLGALFLENDLSTDAFTEARLDVLRILVGQAAISLENARLYDATQRLNVDLAAKEALLRAFLEGMPVGAYVVNAEGRPEFMNRTAAEILGRTLDPNTRLRDVPRVYKTYVAGTDRLYPSDRGPLERALRGERTMVDDVEIRRADRTIPLAVWGTPIFDDDGVVRYAIAAFQDIGPQRAAETERRRLEEQLRRAERLESLGRLAGGIAHDFNNLLTPMLVYSELARDALPAESPIRQNLEEIRGAAERAADLTRQLLAFGREQVLAPRRLDMNQAVRDFDRMFRRLVREDVDLELRLAPELGAVRADASQIQRVLMNLGLNAIDAMPQGGRVTLETERVLHDGVPSVALRVRDTGQGMDADTVARVFDPFFTTKGPAKGTGLGLPTVYGIVAQHGGTLSVQSEPGKGTTFEVLLPCVPDPDAKESSRAPRSPEPPRGRGEMILVVEDDPAVRVVVEEILVREGYRVVATGSPVEALRIAGELGEGVDLVISDVVMPVMSGRELVARLAREHRGLRVLFVSGYSEEAGALPAAGTPGFAVLPKPLSVQVLRDKVRELLDAPSPDP